MAALAHVLNDTAFNCQASVPAPAGTGDSPSSSDPWSRTWSSAASSAHGLAADWSQCTSCYVPLTAQQQQLSFMLWGLDLSGKTCPSLPSRYGSVAAELRCAFAVRSAIITPQQIFKAMWISFGCQQQVTTASVLLR